MRRREGTFWEHLEELVSRLKKSILAIGVASLAIAVFPSALTPASNPGLIELPYEPLLSSLLFRVQNDLLPADLCNPCLFVGPFDLITIYFIGALAVGFLLASPYVGLQIYRFVAPGLYEREKRAVAWFIGPFLLLLATGAAFSYFFVLRFAYQFLLSLIPPESRYQPFFPITEFYSITILMLLGVGLVFTFPVFTSLLIRLGVFTPSDLAKRWREVLIGLLVFSAVITPDGTGITMAILFVPLVALFGIAILAGKIIVRQKQISQPGVGL